MKKKIRILVIYKVSDNPIEDACMETIEYDDTTRISYLYKIIDESKAMKRFENYEKWLDDDFEIKLRSSYGQKKSKIDWNKKIDNIYVKDIEKLTDNDLIIFRTHGGIGSTGDIATGIIKDILEGIIYRLFKKVFITKERAIKIIEKETGYGYDYIKEVIKYFNEWPQMFISSNNFENKKKVEKKIMKSLGYKLKKIKWIIE